MRHRKFLSLLVVVSLMLGLVGPGQFLPAHNVQAQDASILAVTLDDGPVSVVTADDVQTVDLEHRTGTGLNRLLVVGVSWNSASAARTISSVTFTPDVGTAAALTEVITQKHGSNYRYAAIYRLVNPPSGQDGTVTVTFSGGTVTAGIIVGAANFAGVDQTTPFGVSNGAYSPSNNTTPTVTLSGLNGDELVIDSLFLGGAPPATVTPGAGQTVVTDGTTSWDATVANARGAASTEQATGSSVTMSWTAASSSMWVTVAAAINPAAVGPMYDLTVGVDPGGSGSVTLDPAGGTYPADTTVTLTPVAAPCYAFDHWGGTNSGDLTDNGDGTWSIVMSDNKAVTANFVSLPPGTPCYRVNCGGDTLTAPDPDFLALHHPGLDTIPGLTVSNVQDERSTTDVIDLTYVDPSLPMELFQTVLIRGTAGQTMSYDFAVPNGSYNLLLHFAEHYFSSAGQRTFDITVEDVLVFDDYDIFVAAGGEDIAVTESVLTTVSDGVLSLDITAQVSDAAIRGIEVVPAVETGTIIVEKQTEPDGWTDKDFEFTGDATGSIADGEQIVVSDLQAGTYYVQEVVPAGWTLTDIACDDDNSVEDEANFEAEFHLEAGETVKCTFYNLLPLDFGDAPDTYKTTLAVDGARHVIITGHSLGPTIDAELDGQPGANADLDDLLPAPDDEDGVVFTSSLVAGGPPAHVDVDGGLSGGQLDAWIDFNGNGVFDPLEHLWGGTSQTHLAGTNSLSFAVPADAAVGTTCARFRLSIAGNLPPDGFAPDGEVEDYTIEIVGITCYALTLGHTGSGTDPVASPANSTGCATGTYVAGENISLSGATPE